MCCDGRVPEDSNIADLATDLRVVAEEVAMEAAAFVRRRRPEVFGAPGGCVATGAVQSKSTPTDPVTIVDSESEQLIRELLRKYRPDDAILGEEGGGDAKDTVGVRWVVDPIDGTVNFMYGIRAYAVSVAAQIDGRSVAGAVVDVAADLLYSAATGQGATCRQGSSGAADPLSCSAETSLSHALVATGFSYSAQHRRRQGELVASILPVVRDIRRIGSAALDLCMVASGQVDAHYEHSLNPWDWAAGSLIATEAGAVVKVPAATESGTSHVTVAAAPGIATEFLSLLEDKGALEPL
ncbi:inositol monophosphatase family protein [Hoyosella subflava]|uniref:Inositol-1-monophosphatase n=1 Tax=Hoyosella subflava (strain DSM 45089 / JCM 17490 / NBRC 109087 / DQS3-9A1) TaxID=443218 RepID=F6ELG5_HOYSD|nr:inositol monophosphatase family protein [Hoyosella subflava]AEF40215.1 Inositol-1-monophosphatase [Hoyosella subflava DQS3-9A1]